MQVRLAETEAHTVSHHILPIVLNHLKVNRLSHDTRQWSYDEAVGVFLCAYNRMALVVETKTLLNQWGD